MSPGRWPELISFLTRRYPFYSGCGTIANHPVLSAIAPISSDLVWAESPGGPMLVPPNDLVGRSVFFFGDLDPKVTWIIDQVLKPGDHAIDIGANIGLTTLWMSKLVGPQGRVDSFEPNPSLITLLKQTLERNQVNNVRLHDVALGSSEGEMTLNVPEGNLGAASLVRTKGVVRTHTVRVMNLDDVIFRNPVSRIALLKIDVEGFELEALRGARRVLTEIRPDAIIFESNDAVVAGETPPVMRLLQDHDYEILMIPKCVVTMRTQVLDTSRSDLMQGNDFVAAPRGDPFRRLCKLLRAQN